MTKPQASVPPKAQAENVAQLGAWVDRPLNDAEPFELQQQMAETDPAGVIEALRIDDRFWKFVCRNTNTGHFEVPL